MAQVRSIVREVPTIASLDFSPSLLRRPVFYRPYRPSRGSPILHRTSLASLGRFRLYSTESAQTESEPPKPRRSRLRNFAGATTVAAVFFTISFLYHFRDYAKRYAKSVNMTILSDEETLNAFTPPDEQSREIDDYLRNHAIAIALREDPAFTEARPHLKIPEFVRGRSLTAGTLAGPNKIVVPPYIFSEEGGKSLVSLLYLGSDVSGHPGIVHGGLLATLLDEGLARCCFPALPNNIGVTANLNIDYRRPAMADNYVVLRAKTVNVDGRKAWVEGHIETLPKNGEEPVVLVEAKALFIEPRNAAQMKSIYNSAAAT